MTIPNDFPWRAGMVYITPDGVRGRIVDDKDHVRPVTGVKTYRPGKTWGWPMPAGAKTDLTDPATLGALLGAVREAWRSPTAHTRQNGTIRTKDNRIVPAWDVCDLYLDDEGARAIGASRAGSVRCSLLLSESDALIAAWNARPRTT